MTLISVRVRLAALFFWLVFNPVLAAPLPESPSHESWVENCSKVKTILQREAPEQLPGLGLIENETYKTDTTHEFNFFGTAFPILPGSPSIEVDKVAMGATSVYLSGEDGSSMSIQIMRLDVRSGQSGHPVRVEGIFRPGEESYEHELLLESYRASIHDMECTAESFGKDAFIADALFLRLVMRSRSPTAVELLSKDGLEGFAEIWPKRLSSSGANVQDISIYLFNHLELVSVTYSISENDLALRNRILTAIHEFSRS